MAQGKHFKRKSPPFSLRAAFSSKPPPPSEEPAAPQPVYKNRNLSTKRLSLTVKLLIGLLILTLLLCLTVFLLWLHGRLTMTKPVVAPHFPQIETNRVETPVSTQPTETEEDALISYKSQYYRYNTSVTSILIIGVDRESSDSDDEAQQSDFIVLAVLDRSADRITLLNIPRDAMCDIEILNDDGSSAGTVRTQIALSYAYGRTPEERAELCKNSVSSLLCGLPIHGYGAFYIDGIAVLNDLLGGVTVTILDDLPFADMPAGKEMKLNGEQARRYMQTRLTDQLDASLLRLARQKQYLLAMITQAGASLREQPSRIVPLYRSLEPYISTDLSIGSIAYLGSLGVTMNFSGDVTTLAGEMVLGEDGKHAEYHLDQNALYDTLLSVFYDRVER